MINSSIIIDDVRADIDFGLRVLKGGLSNLIPYPERKQMRVNNWYERDGVEADLTTPAFDSKEFQMPLFCIGAGNAKRLLDFLATNGGKHAFTFGWIGRQFNLRILGVSSLEYWVDNAELHVHFSEDEPSIPDEDFMPTYLPIAGQEWVSLNGIGMMKYGVQVLKGGHYSLHEKSKIKEGLIVKSLYSDGGECFAKSVRYEAKDVQIECLMKANTIEDFWTRYDTLLHALTRAGELEISFAQLGSTYKGFYKQCQSIYFDLVPEIRWQFRLTFTLTNYRP